MFASTLPWVITTPFGSAVAPDVKMTSATSCPPAVARWGGMVAAGAVSADNSASRQTGTPPVSGRGTSSPISTALASTIPWTDRKRSAEAR